MKVYIIEYTNWDEHYNIGVFSTYEKAEEYFNTLDSWEREKSGIGEYEVD